MINIILLLSSLLMILLWLARATSDFEAVLSYIWRLPTFQPKRLFSRSDFSADATFQPTRLFSRNDAFQSKRLFSAEAIRDALQLQGVDTNFITTEIYAEA